jgi:MoxR-like ATPase
MLAEQLAESFGAADHLAHQVHHQGPQGLYEYDAVSRLRDSQLGTDKVHDVRNYLKKGKLWEAFEAEERVILLIDEIDKADIEFPNDLLQELDKMEFYVYEIDETIKAKQRPIIIITSNNEKSCRTPSCAAASSTTSPSPTATPCSDRRRALPEHQRKLVSEALDVFFDVRKVPGLKKKPSTSELVDWLKLLMADNIGEAVLRERDPTKAIPPLAGALVKNEQDVQLLERLAFMSRRGNR